jgi:hypothetical protein
MARVRCFWGRKSGAAAASRGGKERAPCRRRGRGGRLFSSSFSSALSLSHFLFSLSLLSRLPTNDATEGSSMNLRDGSVVGGSKGSLPSNSRISQDFARGAARILGRWTALRLAVEGGWGGPESEAKAGLLLDDVVAWFACDSGEFERLAEERGRREERGARRRRLRRCWWWWSRRRRC